jgi:hypothetical protein
MLEHAHDNQSEVSFSDHALLRLSQRGLSEADVEYIMSNGASEQIAAATIYYLRAVDIGVGEQQRYQRLVGSAVITASDRDLVVTVWRNRKHGARNLRRKRGQRWVLPASQDHNGGESKVKWNKDTLHTDQMA